MIDRTIWILERGGTWRRGGESTAKDIGVEVESALAGTGPGTKAWVLPTGTVPPHRDDLHGDEWIVSPDGRAVHQPAVNTPNVDVVPGPDGRFRWRAWGEDAEASGPTRDDAIAAWHAARR